MKGDKGLDTALEISLTSFNTTLRDHYLNEIEVDDNADLQQLTDEAESAYRASLNDVFMRLENLKQAASELVGRTRTASREFREVNSYMTKVAQNASALFAEQQDLWYLDNIICTLQMQKNYITILPLKLPNDSF